MLYFFSRCFVMMTTNPKRNKTTKPLQPNHTLKSYVFSNIWFNYKEKCGWKNKNWKPLGVRMSNMNTTCMVACECLDLGIWMCLNLKITNHSLSHQSDNNAKFPFMFEPSYNEQHSNQFYLLNQKKKII